MKNFETMTYEEIMTTIPTEEIRQRIRQLTEILDATMYESGKVWHKAYSEYEELNAILDERYREENQAAFNAFYAEHIEGKSWEEIDPENWQFYSDWHKDMYGFRPKSI